MNREERAVKPPLRRPSFKRAVGALLSPEQVMVALARESARVDRRLGGDLSLVLFRPPTKRKRSLSTMRLIRTMLARIRVTDDIGWFDNHHLALLLPDTSSAGAWAVAQQICEVVARRGARPGCTLYAYPVDTSEAGAKDAALKPVEGTGPVLKIAS